MVRGNMTGGMSTGGQGMGAAHASLHFDTSQLQAARQAVQSFATGVSTDLTGINPAIAQTESSMGGLTGATRMLGVALASVLTVSAAKSVVGLATVSARLGGVRQEFQNLTQTTTQQSEVMLQSMRKASWGLISDMALIQQANKAILFGVVEDIGDMDRLLLIASARAAAMGTTTEDAFERLVHGIGTLNPIVLRQLGLAISLTDAYEQFAASTGKAADKLTEAEKRQAILNIAYAESADLIEEQARVGNTNAGNLERVTIAATNAGAALGGLIEEDTVRKANALAVALEWIADVANRLSSQPHWGAGWGDVWQLMAGTAPDPRIGSRGPPLAAVSGTVERLSPGVSGGFSQEVQDAQVDYWHGIQAIDRKAHTAIQQATEQYGQARASTIAQFEKSIAREAEDFGRQRARAVAQHERQIAGIRQDAAVREMTAISDRAERLVSMQEDFDRRRADTMEDYHARRAQAQADFDERRAMALGDFEESQAKNLENSQKRLADLDERLHEEREKAQRAHRDNLLNAASRLDARAVAIEQRRFASEQLEREKAGKEAVQAEKDSFEERQEQAQEAFDKQRERELAAFEKQRQQDEAAFAKRLAREDRDYALRLAQDQKAHDKRLADARAADEQRIIDAQEAFDERIAQEDEDRGIRLARQREDHADQLAEMARAQGLRIQQIGEQQAEQRAKLNDEFKDQLTDLGLFNNDRITEQERFKTAATKLWDDMWGDWYKTMEDMHKAEREFAASMGPHPAPVDYFDPDTNVFGAASTSRSTSINIAPGAIVVNEATRPGQTAVEVEEVLIRLLEE